MQRTPAYKFGVFAGTTNPKLARSLCGVSHRSRKYTPNGTFHIPPTHGRFQTSVPQFLQLSVKRCALSLSSRLAIGSTARLRAVSFRRAVSRLCIQRTLERHRCHYGCSILLQWVWRYLCTRESAARSKRMSPRRGERFTWSVSADDADMVTVIFAHKH